MTCISHSSLFLHFLFLIPPSLCFFSHLPLVSIHTLSSHCCPVWVGASAPGLEKRVYFSFQTTQQMSILSKWWWLDSRFMHWFGPNSTLLKVPYILGFCCRSHGTVGDDCAARASWAVEAVHTGPAAGQDAWPEGGQVRDLQAIIYCLELVVESWRVESDLVPLTATLAKSSPYLRPTSAWRNDIFCNCRILFRWLQGCIFFRLLVY